LNEFARLSEQAPLLSVLVPRHGEWIGQKQANLEELHGCGLPMV
jgi:hypothetical protein